MFLVSSDEEGGRDPFLPARKQSQGGGRTRVRGKARKERQVNFGGELHVEEPAASSQQRPDERRVEVAGGGVGRGGREGSFSLLERRIQTLEEGTTASLARIEQALLLIASKK